MPAGRCPPPALARHGETDPGGAARLPLQRATAQPKIAAPRRGAPCRHRARPRAAAGRGGAVRGPGGGRVTAARPSPCPRAASGGSRRRRPLAATAATAAGELRGSGLGGAAPVRAVLPSAPGRERRCPGGGGSRQSPGRRGRGGGERRAALCLQTRARWGAIFRLLGYLFAGSATGEVGADGLEDGSVLGYREVDFRQIKRKFSFRGTY